MSYNVVELPDILPSFLNYHSKFCFSANQDTLSKIMGPAFTQVSTNDNALLKAHETLVKSRNSSSDELEELENRFRLMLLINQLDLQLLSSSVEHMAK